MFSEENGLIEYYGIVVTTNESCKYLPLYVLCLVGEVS